MQKNIISKVKIQLCNALTRFEENLKVVVGESGMCHYRRLESNEIWGTQANYKGLSWRPGIWSY